MKTLVQTPLYFFSLKKIKFKIENAGLNHVKMVGPIITPHAIPEFPILTTPGSSPRWKLFRYECQEITSAAEFPSAVARDAHFATLRADPNVYKGWMEGTVAHVTVPCSQCYDCVNHVGTHGPT